MVNLEDIAKITSLSQEKATILQGLEFLEHGGRIVSMQIARPRQDPDAPALPELPFRPGAGPNVPTAFIDYPPQMIAAIKTALNARVDFITAELTKLGVTT